MAAERRRVDEKVRSWRMLVATAPSIMGPTQRRSHRIAVPQRPATPQLRSVSSIHVASWS